MDAAVGCFRRRGFHQTTMQEICAEAGISAGALYRYFASKTEIIAAIAEEMHGENDDGLLRNAEEIGFMKAVELLASDAYERFAGGDGALFAEVMAEAMRDEQVSASLRPILRQGSATVAEAIRRAQARGEIDSGLDPVATSNLIGAIIQGTALRRAFMRQLDTDAAMAEFRLVAQRLLRPSP